MLTNCLLTADWLLTDCWLIDQAGLLMQFYADFENKYIDQITEKIDLDDYILVFYKSSNGLFEDII